MRNVSLKKSQYVFYHRQDDLPSFTQCAQQNEEDDIADPQHHFAVVIPTHLRKQIFFFFFICTTFYFMSTQYNALFPIKLYHHSSLIILL